MDPADIFNEMFRATAQVMNAIASGILGGNLIHVVFSIITGVLIGRLIIFFVQGLLWVMGALPRSFQRDTTDQVMLDRVKRDRGELPRVGVDPGILLAQTVIDITDGTVSEEARKRTGREWATQRGMTHEELAELEATDPWQPINPPQVW